VALPTDGPPAGVLLVDKPAGPTSHDVVARARKALGVRRVGHAGTLDPFATGLLLLCVGPATRLVRYLHLLDKRYAATLRLGQETSTHDPEGEPVARSEAWRDVDAGRLREVLRAFEGEIEQVPPVYSAVRVGGARAHRLARSGTDVELEARPARVASLRLASFQPPDAEVEAVVGTGTYVRALARDVGRALGCGAHLVALRRTAIGPFEVADALPLESLRRLDSGEVTASPSWCPPARALDWLPSRELSAGELERVRHGAAIPAGGAEYEGTPDRPVALLAGGELVAVAEAAGGNLQPRTVLPDA